MKCYISGTLCRFKKNLVKNKIAPRDFLAGRRETKLFGKPGAAQPRLAGRKWPAGRDFETTDLHPCLKYQKEVVLVLSNTLLNSVQNVTQRRGLLVLLVIKHLVRLLVMGHREDGEKWL